MALVPLVKPLVIKLVTTKKERKIRMNYKGAQVSKTTKIAFTVIVTFVVGLIAPKAIALVGFLATLTIL